MSAIFGQTQKTLLLGTLAGGDVLAGAVLTDNAIIRGDGGVRGVQDSLVTIDDTGHVVGVVGLVSAPSYTFVGRTADGFYSSASQEISAALNGIRSFTLGASGVLTGASTQTVTMGTAGAIALTASGTNQSITLTPSGTGDVILSTANLHGLRINSLGNAARLDFYTLAASSSRLNWSIANNYSTTGALDFLRSTSDSGTPATQVMELSAAGNLLLGGLTTDGTGLLQFSTATTSAGGITFGTDVNIFRNASNSLQLSVPTVVFNNGRVEAAGNDFYISSTNASGALILRSGSATTAITLDSSQNATFAGTVTKIGGTYLLQTSTALTDSAAAQVATLTNSPTAGNPTKWIAINDNGTARRIPAW